MAFQLPEALALLERTPATLATLLRDLPDGWLAADEGPETWNPKVVVGHLLHAERTDWLPRARLILARGPNRTFAAFDRFAQLREPESTLGEQLDQFATLRAENLFVLRGWKLGDAELDLPGEHPALGPVTLRQLLATWVAHDLTHVVQIARVMAKRYTHEVGPWRAYLSVLR
jgi:hypothetical protein